ncbi:hypothetical protein DHEL01_v212613 [Diaporthe helianthi]|uniref:ABC transmembrane type-1 domain-containing protein n=1 Tax=Diaporthe helianthi TaxID=158607 RepID=A0A2P5HFG7_DIAHE|nr:hypothetical protein DHEL01_v212613 [Diaporthe helianthi]
MWETHCSSVSGNFAIEEDSPAQPRPKELENSAMKVPHAQPESKTRMVPNTITGESAMLALSCTFFWASERCALRCTLPCRIATSTSNAVQFIWVQKLVRDSVSVVFLSRSITAFTSISIFAFSVVAIYLSYFFIVLCPRSGLRMHSRQLSALMKVKFTALVTKNSGEITNLFSQDTIIVDRLLPMLLLNISSDKKCISLVAATPPIALMIPIAAAIGYMVQHCYLRTSWQLRHLDLEAKARLCSNSIETLAGSGTIRAFGWSADFKRRNKQLQDVSQAPY